MTMRAYYAIMDFNWSDGPGEIETHFGGHENDADAIAKLQACQPNAIKRLERSDPTKRVVIWEGQDR